ncbi:hypothetical protein DAPPUDRAFT_111848 [Daphnia pulex]|uniref:Uncharacterized protein n=1 Tax=Daphnia pulex TaxID=6669 RepID=E9HAA4_DAPPU|nr:hypothetical protein DAPPUDRAFT_111848 [Daphnia pulex]|eukprot:EFX71330.1 hypothetical protein DAPPUDRAFT_111848 [Daphnia pulex]
MADIDSKYEPDNADANISLPTPVDRDITQETLSVKVWSCLTGNSHLTFFASKMPDEVQASSLHYVYVISCRGIKVFMVGLMMELFCCGCLVSMVGSTVDFIMLSLFGVHCAVHILPASEWYGELLHEDKARRREEVSIVSEFILVVLFGLQFMFGQLSKASSIEIELNVLEAMSNAGVILTANSNIVILKCQSRQGETALIDCSQGDYTANAIFEQQKAIPQIKLKEVKREIQGKQPTGSKQENKAHLLVLCKFSGSIPEHLGNSAWTVDYWKEKHPVGKAYYLWAYYKATANVLMAIDNWRAALECDSLSGIKKISAEVYLGANRENRSNRTIRCKLSKAK